MMNIIRTKAVELTGIEAIAYKQKLAAGGAGIKILRTDGQTAVCTIDKRTGDMSPYGRDDETLFPAEAFDEAYELTCGLPYSARGNIKPVVVQAAQADDVSEEAPAEQVDMTLSDEYTAIVERYGDEKGKMNYTLMNKDFIQFAARSKTVAGLADGGAGQDEIVAAVLKNRAAEISGRREALDEASVRRLIETLDEIDPRSAFKELKAYINRMLSKGRTRG